MSVNDDTILNCINQLKTLLFHNEVFNEMESHPLINLRDQLQEIDNNPQLITKEKEEKLFSILHQFEFSYYYYFIQEYSSKTSSSILIALFDLIRFQIQLNMQIHPLMNDYYFNLSLIYLTSDTTIDYLTNKNDKISSSNIDEYFLHLFTSIGTSSINMKRNISYTYFISHKNIPTFFQLNDSTEHLLQAFIVYLNNSSQSDCYISILKWLSNMTDINGFTPYFVKTGYPNAILQWLSTKQNLSIQSWLLIFTILHNIALHWMGVKAFNKLKATSILKQWKEQYLSDLSIIHSNENDKDILIVYYLVYAILLEPKELKKETISDIQTVLDHILERIILAFDSPKLIYGPFNVCEYLNGLSKLVVNDTFLIYIMSHENIYELFIEKFLLFNNLCETTALNTLICSSLYTIFWSISFQTEYNLKLKLNEKFLDLVEQTATVQSKDEPILIMRRAAKGILFNLDRIDMDVEPIEDITTTNDNNNNDNQIKVMISYAHKDTTFCKKLFTNLQEHFQGYIWVDFDKLSPPYEDDWEEIAKAITQCDIILMIVTENYCSSKSCRREVIHADKRNKRMIPIYQGKDYIPEDWFEIRVGSATWVRFGDKRSDEQVTENLLSLINVQDKTKQTNNEPPVQDRKIELKNQRSIIDNQIIEPPLPATTFTPILEIPHIKEAPVDIIPMSPIEQWTSEEVQQWLDIPSSTLQLSSGRALLTYMNLLSHDDAQYDEYEYRMRNHNISREQFSNLISSFTSIRSLEKVEIAANELPEQWTREEIKKWFQQNHLSDHLFNIFNFIDGSQLLNYAKLIVDSPSRIDEEYERLRNQIGKNIFHLDEYARLLNGLKKLINQLKMKEEPPLCIIL